MTRWIAPFVALLLFAAPGCPNTQGSGAAAGGDGAAAGGASEGKNYFMTACFACHGADAKGMPNLGPDLTASEFAKSKTDEELVKFIIEGRPADAPDNKTKIAMPPRGGNPTLDDAKLLAIVKFLRTLQTK